MDGYCFYETFNLGIRVVIAICLQHDAGQLLESVSVELVVLAIWKKAIQICSSWLASAAGSELPESSSTNESTLVYGGTDLSPETTDKIDFLRPSSACKWAEQGFILAVNHAEKLSDHLRDMNG